MLVVVRIFMNMSTARDLRSLFRKATDAATASLLDVAHALGRTRRSVQQLRAGERGVSAETCRDLAAWLRRRAGRFEALAEDLERAAEEEDTDG